MEVTPLRPMRGTPEYDLWIAAIEIAANAPLKQGENVSSAKISWPLIDQLRQALDELGLDWREVKRVQDQQARAHQEDVPKPPTLEQLRRLLRERGVEFPSYASREHLEGLVEHSDPDYASKHPTAGGGS